MGESGEGHPQLHETSISPEMAAILKNTQEVTVYGAFAGNFSFNRALRGEPPQLVNVDTGRGEHDYSYKGYEKFMLGGEAAGLVDVVQGRGFGPRSELPPSLAADTQVLIIDTLQQPSGEQYEGTNNLGAKSKDYAVVNYLFEQDAVQPVGAGAGRPLASVGVRALLPQAATDKLVGVLTKDPDAIEDFYNGVVGGIENAKTSVGGRYTKGESVIQRVKSDRLAVIDLRGISDKDRRAILEGQYAAGPNVARFLHSLELQGKIQRLNYRNGKHGTVDPQNAKIQIPEVAVEDRSPRVDVTAGKRLYDEALQTFRGSSSSSNSGGSWKRFFRRN